jgi:hypothetical protein
MITLITPTGARLEAFARCEEYMLRQTVKDPIQWIVIDDAEPRTKITIPKSSNIQQEYYRGPVLWTPHINTQRPNMHEALQHVNPKTEAIFVIEDDDYYAPNYLETLLWLLQKFEAVGEANNKYYAIKSRSYREWKNLGHASLCSTGLRMSSYQILYDAVNSGELFMDMAFWRKAFERGTSNVLLIGLNIGVGIKQMPGRHGIGAGHDPEGQEFKKDPSFDMLKRWIPIEEDFNWYKQIASQPCSNSPGLVFQKNWLTDKAGNNPIPVMGEQNNPSKKIENSVALFKR